MVGNDRLAQRARAAMEHDPNAAPLIPLKLQNGVATAECAELDATVTLDSSGEALIAKRSLFQFGRQFNRHRGARMAHRWNKARQTGEQAGSATLVGQK